MTTMRWTVRCCRRRRVGWEPGNEARSLLLGKGSSLISSWATWWSSLGSDHPLVGDIQTTLPSAPPFRIPKGYQVPNKKGSSSWPRASWNSQTRLASLFSPQLCLRGRTSSLWRKPAKSWKRILELEFGASLFIHWLLSKWAGSNIKGSTRWWLKQLLPLTVLFQTFLGSHHLLSWQ